MASGDRTYETPSNGTSSNGTSTDPRSIPAATTESEPAPSNAGFATEPRTEDRGESSGPVAAAQTLETVTVSCLMNAHYHAAREAFLDTVHRWLMFGVIALGAAALVDIFPEADKEWLKGLCSAGAAVFGALDLTFDLSNRARTHSAAKRQYYELLACVREKSIFPAEARVRMERFSAEEEPPYRVLLLSCWNLSQQATYGFKAKAFEIPFWARLTQNILRYPTMILPLTKTPF